MPTVRVKDIDMYHEEHGSGEPLLLIMGWGGNAATWKPQIPGLAEQYRVIAFDNRGVGRTTAPEEPYTTSQMAADTVGLLDALNLPDAHVFGISMGGMIAQEMALAYPQRVRTLILGCTSPGSKRAAGSTLLQRDLREFRDTSEKSTQDVQWFSEFLKRLWSDEALAQADGHLQDFILSLIRIPSQIHGLRGQAAAIAAHDTYRRLSQIRQPTLVIAGDEDPLIDPRNSIILSKRIPGAELHYFSGLKHAFHLEQPEQVNSVIVDFIGRVSQTHAA
jgi:pimeloyl-ACP methyl ester carboxylesterase